MESIYERFRPSRSNRIAELEAQLKASEERERVMREALEYIKDYGSKEAGIARDFLAEIDKEKI